MELKKKTIDMLKVENISHNFDDTKILDNINFTLNQWGKVRALEFWGKQFIKNEEKEKN